MAEFPHEIVAIEGDDDSSVKSLFKSVRSGLIRVGDKGWVMADSYKHHAANIYNMEVRPDDIWLVTFPKSGTTVTQELVWLLMNNLDYGKSKVVPLFERSKFIEHCAFFHDDVITETAAEYPQYKDKIENMRIPKYKLAENDPSPRIIKTHVPFSLLPPGLDNKCKVIYVARNPKDVSVSYFHHNSTSKAFGFSGDYSEYLSRFFINDLVITGPFWEHVREGWQRRDNPNVLFFFYEDLMKDMESTVKKVANFVGKNLTQEEVKSLVNHLQIDNFRENVKIRDDDEFKAFMYTSPKVFIRKGGVGNNKEITEDLDKLLNTWIQKNQTDIKIPFQMK